MSTLNSPSKQDVPFRGTKPNANIEINIVRLLLLIGIGLSSFSCQKINDAGDDPSIKQIKISEIRSINLSDSTEVALTNDSMRVLYANYLPNGQRIIFIQTEQYKGVDGIEQDRKPQTMYSMRPDGTDRIPLLTKTSFIPILESSDTDTSQRVLFTPDSRKIIYTMLSPSSIRYARDIYCVNGDGSNDINLTHNSSSTVIENIALSNDGRQIVYSEYDSLLIDVIIKGERRICIIGVDGTNRLVVKKFQTTRPLCPQFLPSDNQKIVYLEQSTTDYQRGTIKILSLADTSVEIIGSYPPLSYYPAIIDKQKMVFEGNSPTHSLSTIDLFTGDVLQLIPDPFSTVNPSPDGTLLAMTLYGGKVTIARTNGSGIKIFHSDVKGDMLQPFISPDNKKILFRSYWKYDAY